MLTHLSKLANIGTAFFNECTDVTADTPKSRHRSPEFQSLVIPPKNSGPVGDDTHNAIEAGKEVTFHEHRISANGWTGYGYIIVDPDTGAGVYLIEVICSLKRWACYIQ